MSASEEFPRGGFTTVLANGTGTPSVILPAVQSVIHVIDLVEFNIQNTGTGLAYGPNIVVSSTVIGSLVVCQANVPANLVATGSDSANGPIQGGIGEAVTISASAPAIAGIVMFLRVHWHDI